ncbi:MAG: inner-rane translocator [Marmoricola sp.]|jgi:ribose transport system permease protein|nr:inner-rane translocator [Marmoricola sp.]
MTGAVSDTTSENASATPRTRKSVGEVIEVAGLPIFLVILIAFFMLHPQTQDLFAARPNLINILGNQSVTGLVAVAMVIPLVSGYFDLSVAAIAGLANVAIASAMVDHGLSTPLAILVGVGVGLAAGALNAFLVAGLRLNGFIATLGTFTLLSGVLQWYTKGTSIFGVPRGFANWGSLTWLGIPRPFYLLIVVAAIVWYALMHTPNGRQLEAIGSNENAARLVGISVDRLVALSFLGSALVASIAGALLTSRQGGADPTVATNYLFPALAAVFLGATTIRPGRYNVWGTIIGIFTLAVAINGFTFLGAEAWVQNAFNGLALVLAVAVSTLMGRQRERKAKRLLMDTDDVPPAPEPTSGPGEAAAKATPSHA